MPRAAPKRVSGSEGRTLRANRIRGAVTAIETMLLEERRYPPPPEFAAQANAKPDIYDRDPDEFWETEARERVTWFEPFTELQAVGAAVREVVRRRQAQHHLQLRRPPRRGRPRRQGRLPLGGRARRRPARRHVRRPPAGDHEARERAQVAGRGEGHAGRDLHGHGPRDGRRDARVRADRRAAHRRVRRLLGRLAERAACTTWSARC